MKTDWFEDWFNTDEYLEVYKQRNEEEAEELSNLILLNTQIKAESSVLDMACGAGRHSISFAKKGFVVTAVDLSERLLAEAKLNADKADVKIEFVKSDIRNFISDKKYDLILNLFTSFGYFESDEENFGVLKKAYDILKDNGYFVLDYFNKNYIDQHLVPVTETISGKTLITQKRSIEQNRVVKRISIKKNGDVKNYLESVRLYDYDEIVTQMNSIGFKIHKTFGDFFGSKFDVTNSQRIIIIAKK